MRKLLAIDIGNTNITAGLFRGVRLVRKAKTPTHASYLYGRFFRKLLKSAALKAEDLDAVSISSVVPLALSRLVVEFNKMAARSERNACKHCIAGRDRKVPIRNMYRQ